MQIPIASGRLSAYRAELMFQLLVVAVLFGGSTDSMAGLPVLISRQPVAVQKAWNEIEQIVAENEKLELPLPEPYLARGDLLSRVGGQEEALADYLKATELFFRANPTPAEQARHLSRLRKSLDAVVQQPRPRFPSEAALEFGKGVTAFRKDEFVSAESCFAESCQLMPDVPLYRVHRALALRQLGQTEAAKRQVAIALSLIRAKGLDTADEMAQLNRGLEQIQGGLRLWLSRELEVAIASRSNRTIRIIP